MNGASTQGDPAGASEDGLGRLALGPLAKERVDEFEAQSSKEIPRLREGSEEALGWHDWFGNFIADGDRAKKNKQCHFRSGSEWSTIHMQHERKATFEGGRREAD